MGETDRVRVRPYWLAIGAIIVLSITACLLAEWQLGAYVPGVSDNATGTAAVLTIGESWVSSPPTDAGDVELVVLFTGCEESGLFGSAAWVRAHKQELQELPTHFINLDGFGYGKTHFVGKEHSLAGMPSRFPNESLELCRQTACKTGIDIGGPLTLPVQGDSRSFLRAHVPGALVVCVNDNDLSPNYHQLSDTSANLDFDVAWNAARYSDALVRAFASQ